MLVLVGPIEEQDDNDPLCKNITKLKKLAELRGNHKSRDNYCCQGFKDSYSKDKSHSVKISSKGSKVCQ